MADDITLTVGVDASGVTRELNKLDGNVLSQVRSTKRLERGYRELDRAFNAGKISAQKYALGIQQIDAAIDRAAAGQQRLGAATQAATKKMSRSGVVTQQVGYQVGDFLVQVQSGTNWMVAFGQQATQLAGLLQGKFIALGAALGIAIPLVTALGAAWMRTRKDGSEAVDTLRDHIKSLIEDTKSLREENELLLSSYDNLGFKRVQEEINKLREQESTIRRQIAVLEEASAGRAKSLLADAKLRLDTLLEEIGRLEKISEEYENQKRLSEAIAKSVEMTEQELQVTLTTLERNNQWAERYRESFESLTEEVGEAAAQMLVMRGVDISKPVSEAAKQGAILASKLGTSLENGIRLGQTDVANGVAVAAEAAKTLAQNLNISLRAAMAMAGMISTRPTGDVADPRDPRYGSQDFTLERIRRQIESGELYNSMTSFSGSAGSGSSGGGAGGAESVGRGVFSFMEQFMDEDEMAKLDIWREEQLAKLQEFNEKELEILRQHGIDKATIEEEYQNRIREIQAAERDLKLSGYESLFGAMANLFQQGNDKLLKISKAFALAEAGVSIARGAAKALELPFPANLGAWATVISTGAQALSAIRSASPGNPGGLSGGGSIATPSGSTATPQRVLIEGLEPDSLFTGQMLSDLFDKFYEENEERGVVFQVST